MRVSAAPEKAHCGVHDAVERGRREVADGTLEKLVARGEQLTGTRVARMQESPTGEVGGCQRHGERVAERVAAHLAKDEVVPPCVVQDASDGKLGLIKIGKRKSAGDY